MSLTKQFETITPIGDQILVKKVDINLERIDSGLLSGLDTTPKGADPDHHFMLGMIEKVGPVATKHLGELDGSEVYQKFKEGQYIIWSPNTAGKTELIGLGLWLVSSDQILALVEVKN